ncbi:MULTISPECIES: hypothetical protein [unclassified Prochlorococcus]|uniref:hypothetical protein n=1 Tax=unclassified Prochlorococcus TaxID=2627481 RepID=UPI0005339FEA|nr:MULTISPECIES: hypothetical protein [unclassified Prochlorococcus]KGG17390.1 hypothetical protein EV07_0829 [Prochlorococcus sp. MIT 0603]
MAYSQALVLAGGIAHVPILITALKFADSKTLKLNKTKAAAIQLEKEQKAAEKAAADAAIQAEADAKKKAAAAAAAAQLAAEPESE